MGDSLLDLLTTAVTIALLVGLVVVAFRIEPHWVSRDGHRFICKGQLIDDHGNTAGNWREYRFRVDDGGRIEARRRSVFGGRGPGLWRVQLRSSSPPRRKALFLLTPVLGADLMLAIRLPERSRAVEVLDDLVPKDPSAR